MTKINSYTNEFYHHGIKGQKWGVRRYQKKDGSLTPAGKKRYRLYNQDRYNILHDKYKKLGYSDEEASKKAKGQAATEKTLKIAGSIALTAAVGYAGYKYYDVTKDRYISPDKVIQTVHKGDISERIKPGNPFYASYTKKDNTIYASKVFSHFTDESKITRLYTKDGIKVASEKTGRKIFDDLVDKNPEVAAYSKRMGHFKDGRKAYERFNYSLVLRNNSDTAKTMGVGDLDHDKIHNIFYNELKKRGYGGVIDVNDSRREGFTFNPVIIFDNQKKYILGTTNATKEHLGDKRLKKGIKYTSQRATSLNPLNNPQIVGQGSVFVSSVGITVKQNKDLNKRVSFVERYKQEHPNTKLTNKQINNMYDKQKKEW